MLELKNITKSYKTEAFSQRALDDVSICFRKSEFVAVLGQSGSGKTTLLNIIGGLDRYDSGDLVIDGRSTKNFKGTDWDAYRNNSIGFVFQSYNLIGHITVLANIEMSMTLSGISLQERRARAMEALDKVGLREHARKKPAQLSGGQMQRIAIARAIVNDPDIILADEPTGALDSQTSIQIMDIIREIARDKLVIMVTHNQEIARRYATRIIELSDGRVTGDSNPFSAKDENGAYSLKKTSMSFPTALKLSFTNILTKKGRTFLTAFASSIGIIGIALIMSFSNGLDIKISEFESTTLAEFPIVISQQTVVMTEEKLKEMRDNKKNGDSSLAQYPDTAFIYPYDKEANSIRHTNTIDKTYLDYINKVDPALLNGISYTNSTGFNLLAKQEGKACFSNRNKLHIASHKSFVRRRPDSR